MNRFILNWLSHCCFPLVCHRHNRLRKDNGMTRPFLNHTEPWGYVDTFYRTGLRPCDHIPTASTTTLLKRIYRKNYTILLSRGASVARFIICLSLNRRYALGDLSRPDLRPLDVHGFTASINAHGDLYILRLELVNSLHTLPWESQQRGVSNDLDHQISGISNRGH